MTWIAGDNQLVSPTETHIAAVAPMAQMLTVSLPNGGLLAPAPVVTVSPATASLSHTFTAIVASGVVGEYRLAWRLSFSDGEVLERNENRVCTYTDVGALVRRRLQETTTTLADADLDPEVWAVIRMLQDRFTALQLMGGYASLMGLDQERFDWAAGLITALRLRPSRAKTLPVGEVSQIKLGQSSFVYADGSSGVPLEQQWLQEAVITLGRVSVIQAQFQAAATAFQPFRVSGPTRYAVQQGSVETLLGGVIRLLTDHWFLDATGENTNGDAGFQPVF